MDFLKLSQLHESKFGTFFRILFFFLVHVLQYFGSKIRGKSYKGGYLCMDKKFGAVQINAIFNHTIFS